MASRRRKLLVIASAALLLMVGSAEAEDWSTLMSQARNHAMAGRMRESETCLRQALKLVGASASFEAAQTNEALASILAAQRRHAEAGRLYSAALRIRERLEPRRPVAEAQVLSAWAASLRATYRLDEALRVAESSVKRAAEAGENDTFVMGGCRVQLALVHHARGELASAESELEKALSIFNRMGVGGQENAAQCHLLMGWIQLERGKIGLAEKSFAYAKRRFERQMGKDSEPVRRARDGLASVHMQRGDLGAARRELQSLVSAADSAGTKDEADALVRLKLAGLLLDSGVDRGVCGLLSTSEAFLRAETSVRRAQLAALNGEWTRAGELFTSAESALAGSPSSMALIVRLRVEALIREGKPSKARRLLLARQANMREHQSRYHCLLAACSLADGQAAEGAKSARQAILQLPASGGSHREVLAYAEILLGEALRRMNRSKDALVYYQRAVERIDGLGLPMVELMGLGLLGLGRAERECGDRDRARKHLRAAADSLKSGAPVVRRLAKSALGELATLLEEAGQDEGAEEVRKEAMGL